MEAWQSYRLRVNRQTWRARATIKKRELSEVCNLTKVIKPNDILLFSTIRNEEIRLPFFLKYYRNLGVNHFILVDNHSSDGSLALLKGQPDVSIWQTEHSYKTSHFGVDWLNCLQSRYGHGHWTLVVDPDEFFIYPFCDNRPLRALTDWLDANETRSFGAMLLDMYPKGPILDQTYHAGQDPLEIAGWFDPGNYTIEPNTRFRNLWIQGGPRARMFFAKTPRRAPALNKIPLVKWHRAYTYISSTHMLLPRGLNVVYDTTGGERLSGLLLHTKFLNTFHIKVLEEVSRQTHYAKSLEYQTYAHALRHNPDLWCEWSEKFTGWQQLETLGLMSKGRWL